MATRTQVGQRELLPWTGNYAWWRRNSCQVVEPRRWTERILRRLPQNSECFSTPWYCAEASKTIRVFVVVLSDFTIGKWGRNHLVEGCSSDRHFADVSLWNALFNTVAISSGNVWFLEKPLFSILKSSECHFIILFQRGWLSFPRNANLITSVHKFQGLFDRFHCNSFLSSQDWFTLVNSLYFP